MELQIQQLPDSKRSPETIQENPLPGNQPQDPLISKGWQREQYVGITILFIAVITAIGFFSRRFEYALLFALALSIVLIVFFLTV
ncbi:hypothetical protein [Anabaena sp. UHCC 0399]|uniref:hypothetical protein n=1 Tax=Anabaena sp. UHCC 0399 TaxID=3110238 RepID=UPI002B221582|nr:hypothetical protein [Anabaena sp. UHCC 0399]MEA5566235.1 hypothetical protein [Anabaena sp. UHCC 0399]